MMVLHLSNAPWVAPCDSLHTVGHFIGRPMGRYGICMGCTRALPVGCPMGWLATMGTNPWDVPWGGLCPLGRPMGRIMGWSPCHWHSHVFSHGTNSSHGRSHGRTHGQHFILWHNPWEGPCQGYNAMYRPMGYPMGWLACHGISRWSSHNTARYVWDASWTTPWVVPWD